MELMKCSVYAVIIAFIAGIIMCPALIPVLHRLKYGQTERDDGPQSHLKKSGTPTKGGIAILAALLVSSLFFISENNDVLVYKGCKEAFVGPYGIPENSFTVYCIRFLCVIYP